MTLPSFDYAAPDTLAEVIALLASRPGVAMPIAGGQSLMPLLAFRLAGPSLLVDLRKVPGLSEISVDDTGVRLGAKVRWCDIERDVRLRAAHPLLSAAISHVAHYQIRNRGTVGGSLAHADPAAELPGVAVACDSDLVLLGPLGSRVVPAAGFFTGPLMTSLEPGELITELRMPAWPTQRRWSFQEICRRRGDFAIAGIALYFDEDDSARARNVHVGAIGVADCPYRLNAVEAVLEGHVIDDDRIALAANTAKSIANPPDDLHGSSDYRRALVVALVEQTLAEAIARKARPEALS